MTNPLLIYVAGPYRAPTAWQREQNIHRAREVGVMLARAGAYPVIPHANTAHLDGEADDALWLFPTVYKYVAETGDTALGQAAVARFRHAAGGDVHGDGVGHKKPVDGDGRRTFEGGGLRQGRGCRHSVANSLTPRN